MHTMIKYLPCLKFLLKPAYINGLRALF